MTAPQSMAGRDGDFASGMRKPYMIISIDFGTTFSGVCWTWSGDLGQVHTIQSWDDVGSAKVPTRVEYEGLEPVAWGFEAENTETTFEWFKLMLDYENLPSGIKTSQRVQQTHDKLQNWPMYHGNPVKAAMKVTKDYLERLWRHAVRVILEQEGQSWARGMPCKVVITRPAIWSQKASFRTRKAAEKAILPNFSPFESINISMVSEPEAAAQAVLQAPAVARRPDLTQPGDIFLICDAGGGTVDVISYEVQSLKPMKLTECAEGKGDLCGAIFIDDEFERFIQLHVGPKNWAKLSSEEYRRVMEAQWERGIKRQFDSTKRSIKWTVDIPGFRSFAFNRDHIETLFQPACSRARTLICQQVDQVKQLYDKRPKAIVLVGGLGSSRYLSHILRMEYHNKIEIRHSAGNETWTAVCRGAVMAAAEEIVVARISRLHYGFAFDVPYDPMNEDHRSLDIDRVIWDKPEQRNMVTGKMEWIVKRVSSSRYRRLASLLNQLEQGARITHIRPSPCFTAKQYIKYPEEMALGKIHSELWVCDDKEAPKWKSAGVRLLCTIVASLDATFAELPEYVSPACDPYRVVEIDIVVFPNGNTLDFSVYFQNRRLDMEIEWPGHRHNSRNVAIEEA